MRAPRLVPGAKLAGLTLTPIEGFVLSRLDGALTIEDVAALTSVDPGEVLELVERLVAAGVVEWAGDPTTSEPPPREAPMSETRHRQLSVRPPAAEPRVVVEAGGDRARKVSGVFAPPPSSADRTSVFPPPSAGFRAPERVARAEPTRPVSSGDASRPVGRTPIPSSSSTRPLVRTSPAQADTQRVLYDPAELDEPGVDLDVERRREILDAYYKLERGTHYDVLGVVRDADKAAIREAYFRLSKRFHPDTLFGKSIGGFRSKMEAVFQRLTDAYETLGKAKRRAEYDASLPPAPPSASLPPAPPSASTPSPSRGPSSIPSGGPSSSPSPSRGPSSTPSPSSPSASSPGPSPGGSSTPSASSPSPSRGSSSPSASRGPSSTPSPSTETPTTAPATPPPMSDRERRNTARELLERRLRGATGKDARPPSPPPPQPTDRGDILRGLASSLKQASAATAGAKLERFLVDAATAEKARDLVGLVNALQFAVSAAPDRADLAERLATARLDLAKKMVPVYERQATQEEERGDWAAAARTWQRTLEGAPDRPSYLARAAVALLETREDLRKAKELAERAVALAPEDVRSRIALGRVFLAVGMRANARRELQAAAKLDPKNEFVKNQLRELK